MKNSAQLNNTEPIVVLEATNSITIESTASLRKVGGDSSEMILPASSRDHLLLKTSIHDIQNAPPDHLLNYQMILSHGAEFGVWETLKNWAPFLQPSLLSINIRSRILHFIKKAFQINADEVFGRDASTGKNCHLINASVLLSMQYLVLCRIGPAGIGKTAKNLPLSPTTLIHIAYRSFPALMAAAISKYLRHLGNAEENNSEFSFVFHRLKEFVGQIMDSDLTALTKAAQEQANLEIRRIRALAGRGLWHNTKTNANRANNRLIKMEMGAQISAPRMAKEPHRPLPDEYVAEMGKKSLWIMENIGPNIQSMAPEIEKIFISTNELILSKSRISVIRGKKIQNLLDGYAWRQQNGLEITFPPFHLELSHYGKNSHKERNKNKQIEPSHGDASCESGNLETDQKIQQPWPPRTYSDVIFLMNAVQMAHLFIVSMAMAGRKSEVLALKKDCIAASREGENFIHGRTYKLSTQLDGEKRKWIVPDLAIDAVKQQIQLVNIANRIGRITKNISYKDNTIAENDSLWIQLGPGGKSNRSQSLTHISFAFNQYARTLNLELNPGGQSLRLHRFRKTIARLVALALTQAPKILMNVFGHKSIEMTLYYILTDKDLRSDIEKVSRELRIMRAKEVVSEMEAAEHNEQRLKLFGGYGGPAAEKIHTALKLDKDRSVRIGDKWGANHAMELASILTLNGQAWQLVKPGVICTKFSGTEWGACNGSRGNPALSRCQTDCAHRLEHSSQYQDADASIAAALQGYVDSGNSRDFLIQAHWAQQVRSHISRFLDLRQKWISNPTIFKIVNNL